MRSDPKIVFWGSPQVSREILEFLYDQFDICGVVSQPPRPFGRKRVLRDTPVSEFAKEHSIPLITPETFDDDTIVTLKGWDADVFIVIAYGRIIPREILEIPHEIPINIHYSLLPKFRGASPITFALLDGAEKTGVTIIEMNEKLDSGDILFQMSLEIGDDDTYESLETRLTGLAKNAIFTTLERLEEYIDCKESQDHSSCCYTTMLDREYGRINWLKEPHSIVNHIKALCEWPQAFTFLNGKEIKVLMAEVLQERGINAPGKVLDISKKHFTVGAGHGSVLIKRVKPFGKSAMGASDFINGKNIVHNDKFVMAIEDKLPRLPELDWGQLERFHAMTLHHTNSFNHTKATVEEIVERVRKLHLSWGWDDIGYHLLIGKCGTVFPGRPLNQDGAHVKGKNKANLGIALVGDLDLDLPTPLQIESLKRVIKMTVEKSEARKIMGHCEISEERNTSCPGAMSELLLDYLNNEIRSEY